MFHFYIPENDGFLMFLGGIEMEYWTEIGQIDFWKSIPSFVGLGSASSHKMLVHLNLWDDKKCQQTELQICDGNFSMRRGNHLES